MNSRVFIADNTGAKSAEMIRRLGQNKKTASVGDVIVCNVKEASTDSSVKKGEVVVPLSKIHEGKIAIVAYHDEDSNGKLKTGLFWRPKEGFAFSNNYQPKGPPSFEKAAIVLVHGEPVVIELNY